MYYGIILKKCNINSIHNDSGIRDELSSNISFREFVFRYPAFQMNQIMNYVH